MKAEQKVDIKKSVYNSPDQKPLLRRGWGRLYTHLFFDLDNTLWDFDTNSRLAMEQTLLQKELLPKLPSFDSFFQVYEKINKSLWSEYHLKRVTKQNLIVDRFSRSLSQFGIEDLDWKELNNAYLENMALQTQLFPKTIETLNILRAKGYRMYIITNGFREVQRAKLANCGLSDFFTKVFISEEIQTTKPHREIFEHALRSANAPKNKSIMIGDSWETDIEGALNFGMDQIMLLNNGLNAIPKEIEPMRKTGSFSFINIKKLMKTRFINELCELDAIL